MDIKLRARLAAYAKVETLEPSTSETENGCDLIDAGPVRGERIDTLFSVVESEETPEIAPGVSRIDAMFDKR